MGAAVAAFMDVETAQVSFQAGTLDLKTDDVDGVSQTIEADRMKPGQPVEATIVLHNSGSLPGSTLDIEITYVKSGGGAEKSADDVAAVIRVDSLNYGGASILGGVADLNENGYLDLHDLKQVDLSGLAGISPAGEKDFQITITLNTTDNDFQGHGVDITFTFVLHQ